MSQSGYTPIQLYRTTTASATPSAGNLSAGELAINLTDEKLFFKNASGTVKVLASTGAGNAGGSNTQVQYNSSGVLTGSSSFVFDGTNVGIGTSSPGAKLVVSEAGTGFVSFAPANAATSLVMRLGYNTDYSQITADSFGGNLFIGADESNTKANSYIAFRTDASEKMRLDASGNLGLGATPTNFPNYTALEIRGKTTTYGGIIRLASADNTIASLNFVDANGYCLGTTTNTLMRFITNDTERARIDSSGNVGIGTTTPRAMLDVGTNASGSTTSTFHLGYSGLNFYGFRIANTINPSLESAGTLSFQRGTTAAWSDVVTISDVGNVGIGTTAPTTLLDVFSATAANLSVRGNSSTNITAHRSSTDAIGPNSVLRKSRGTSDSQTAVASGDTMGTLFFSAYGGTNNRNIASIAGVVDTYSTDASIGSYLTFSTTPNGSVTPAERMRITSTGGITSSDLADAVGYKGLPQNAQTSSYTLALSDMGKHISITTGGVVIPANASVAFPIGSAIAIYNNSGSNQTISITSDTLRQAGTANTGSRTLAQYGLCTVTKVASTTWVISGAGVS